MSHNDDRDLRSAHGWSRCGSETKGFSEAAARICGYVEIYRGIYVNPPVQRSDLHKSSLPINLQVNPDRSTEIAMEKKTGSPARAGRRDFSLCKAFRLNDQGLAMWRYSVLRQPGMSLSKDNKAEVIF